MAKDKSESRMVFWLREYIIYNDIDDDVDQLLKICDDSIKIEQIIKTNLKIRITKNIIYTIILANLDHSKYSLEEKYYYVYGTIITNRLSIKVPDNMVLTETDYFDLVDDVTEKAKESIISVIGNEATQALYSKYGKAINQGIDETLFSNNYYNEKLQFYDCWEGELLAYVNGKEVFDLAAQMRRLYAFFTDAVPNYNMLCMDSKEDLLKPISAYDWVLEHMGNLIDMDEEEGLNFLLVDYFLAKSKIDKQTDTNLLDRFDCYQDIKPIYKEGARHYLSQSIKKDKNEDESPKIKEIGSKLYS